MAKNKSRKVARKRRTSEKELSANRKYKDTVLFTIAENSSSKFYCILQWNRTRRRQLGELFIRILRNSA